MITRQDGTISAPPFWAWNRLDDSITPLLVEIVDKDPIPISIPRSRWIFLVLSINLICETNNSNVFEHLICETNYTNVFEHLICETNNTNVFEHLSLKVWKHEERAWTWIDCFIKRTFLEDLTGRKHFSNFAGLLLGILVKILSNIY